MEIGLTLISDARYIETFATFYAEDDPNGPLACSEIPTNITFTFPPDRKKHKEMEVLVEYFDDEEHALQNKERSLPVIQAWVRTIGGVDPSWQCPPSLEFEAQYEDMLEDYEEHGGCTRVELTRDRLRICRSDVYELELQLRPLVSGFVGLP